MFGGGGLLRKERKTIASVWFLVTSRLKHSGLGCLDIHHNATLMEEAWPALPESQWLLGAKEPK